MIQFSDCYVEPGQRYSMISETLPNWGGLKVENFGGKFKFQNLSSWNTLFSTLGGDEITFSGFIWGQELITKCPCWVKLHITEDNFCHFFKPPQFRFFLSKNVKLFEAIRSPLGFSFNMSHLKALNYPDYPVKLSADNPVTGYLKNGTIWHSLVLPCLAWVLLKCALRRINETSVDMFMP